MSAARTRLRTAQAARQRRSAAFLPAPRAAAPAGAPADRQPLIAEATGLPPSVVTLAAWSIALLVIGAFVLQLLALLGFFSEVSVPIAIALLITALAAPGVDWLERIGIRRPVAALVVVLGGLIVLGGLMTLVGQQVTSQFDQLRADVAEGIGQVQTWLREGPVNMSESQLVGLIDRARETLQSTDSPVVQQAAAFGTTVGHFFSGFFIALFATFFFCAQGASMWRWALRLIPGSYRPEVDASGRVAWVALTAFVRATVLVALTDAFGIALAAVVLGIPLALPIGLLVFLGAFVPIIGAFLSGIVAVLVALVAEGWVTALLMFGAVILVQQLESHVLQPFLMGRFVAVHPLGIILAIAAGLVAGGIVGALIAVPLVACANAVGKHLAGRDRSHDAPAGDEPGALAPDDPLPDSALDRGADGSAAGDRPRAVTDDSPEGVGPLADTEVAAESSDPEATPGR